MGADGGQFGRRRFLRTGVTALGVGLGAIGGCLSSPTGEAVWSIRTDGSVWSSPTVGGDRLFVGSQDYHLYAIAADSGGIDWRSETRGAVFSSPVFVPGSALDDAGTDGGRGSDDRPAGMVCVGSQDGSVYAYSADGITRWTFETEGEVLCSPTVATGAGLPEPGVVYVGGTDNRLYALSAADGSEIWRVELTDSVQSSPTVVGVPDGEDPPGAGRTLVIVGSYDTNVYAFDATNGDRVWQASTGDQVLASATVAGGAPDGPTVYQPTIAGEAGTDGDDPTVYVGSDDGNLYALDLASGSVRWRFETDDLVRSTPTVVDDAVYVGSHDYHLYALDRHRGERRWRFGTDNRVFSSPTVVDGTAYVGSFSGSLYAVDASDGRRRWSYATDGVIPSSPTVVDGTVYVGSGDERLYAIRPP